MSSTPVAKLFNPVYALCFLVALEYVCPHDCVMMGGVLLIEFEQPCRVKSNASCETNIRRPRSSNNAKKKIVYMCDLVHLIHHARLRHTLFADIAQSSQDIVSNKLNWMCDHFGELHERQTLPNTLDESNQQATISSARVLGLNK